MRIGPYRKGYARQHNPEPKTHVVVLQPQREVAVEGATRDHCKNVKGRVYPRSTIAERDKHLLAVPTSKKGPQNPPPPTPRIHWNTNITEQSTHTPGEYLIDLDVGVSHRHELNLDLANDALSDEGSKVPEKYVVLVLRNAVVHLDGEVVDVRSLPDGNVQLEQPVEDQVD